MIPPSSPSRAPALALVGLASFVAACTATASSDGGPEPRDAAMDAHALDAASLDAARFDAGHDANHLSAPPTATLDAYGGDEALPIDNTSGYFRVAHAFDRDWLVTPLGHAFVSFGVDHMGPDADTDLETGRDVYAEWVDAHYASEAAWAEAAAARLDAWTFNTIGAWSRHDLFVGRLPQTPVVRFADAGWNVGSSVDVFDPAWEAEARARAESAIAPFANDPGIIGWFTDNEMRWGPDWRSLDTDLFDAFLALPATAPGKLALVAAAEAAFGTTTAFDAAFSTTLTSWDALRDAPSLASLATGERTETDDARALRHAWIGQVADRYFEVTTAAIHRVDPNHLVLGCRFVSWITPPAVVEAAGRHVDVVSVNHYEITPSGERIANTTPELAYRVSTEDWLAEFASLSGRPLLVSEFGARAHDSGLPNTYPPPILHVVWPTQEDRADALERYGRAMLEKPYIVGVHWFEWCDEPPGGRFDGEDSNWGLVTTSEVPYEVVTSRAPIVGPLQTYAGWR